MAVGAKSRPQPHYLCGVMTHKKPKQTILRNRYGDSEDVEMLQLLSTTIGYIVNGKLTLHNHNRITQIYTGEIFVLSRGTHIVEYHTMEGRLYEEILFTPGDHMLATTIKELQLFTNLHFRPSKEQEAKPYAHQRAGMPLISMMNSIREYHNNDIFDRCRDMLRIKIFELVYLLLDDGYDKLASELIRLCTQRKLPISQFAMHNILSNKPLKTLATEYGMSLSGFKREFKRVLHKTPHRWFMEQRLEMAARLLKSTNNLVKAIAQECHFVSTSHFIRLFHNHFGLTPTEYRSKQQNHHSPTPKQRRISL